MHRIGRLAQWFVVAVVLGACDNSRDATPQYAVDSFATTRELHATLAGEAAPGEQSYSYRGLYAGMSRAHLERDMRSTSLQNVACPDTVVAAKKLQCHYEAMVGPDSAQLSLDVSYDKAPTEDGTLARVIVATRALPIAVDGVSLARMLADAFEKQTSLLDKRDATFGTNHAEVRMGTVNGARQNFVDIVMETKNGRQILTVKLSRSGGTPKY